MFMYLNISIKMQFGIFTIYFTISVTSQHLVTNPRGFCWIIQDQLIGRQRSPNKSMQLIWNAMESQYNKYAGDWAEIDGRTSLLTFYAEIPDEGKSTILPQNMVHLKPNAAKKRGARSW